MANKIFKTRKNPALYEINTVAWLFELSKKLGKRITLKEVPAEEWSRLSRSGIELVWLMGVWKRSQAGRRIALTAPEMHKIYSSALPGWTEEDIIGSSYSISAHEPDPSAGSWEDIDYVRAELHRQGMGLILDYVPNHTGTDHPWVKEHPEYYVQGSDEDYKKDSSAFLTVRNKGKRLYLALGKDPYFPPWTDTVQLNYFNPELRKAMLGELAKIAGHCDGVRCDMAILVLNDIFSKTWGWAKNSLPYAPPAEEFWIQALNHAPALTWIAEAYWDTEQIFQEMGFDYVYDKKLYDLMRWSSPADIRSYLKTGVSYQEKLLRFVENHDEERAATAFGKDRLAASVILLSTLPGMKLYHHGQIDGKRVRLPLQLRQAIEEPPDNEIGALYERVLNIARQDVFHSGEWRLEEVQPAWDGSFPNLLAYTWRLDTQMKLVVINLRQKWSQGKVRLQVLEHRDYTLTDELNDKTYIRSGDEMANSGLHVILEGYQAHVFDVK